jgi:hypothetical protein
MLLNKQTNKQTNKAMNYFVVGTSFHAVLFDVDSKTPGTGMSCPPPQFLEPSLLQDVKKCVGDKGQCLLTPAHILICYLAYLTCTFHQQKIFHDISYKYSEHCHIPVYLL